VSPGCREYECLARPHHSDVIDLPNHSEPQVLRSCGSRPPSTTMPRRLSSGLLIAITGASSITAQSRWSSTTPTAIDGPQQTGTSEVQKGVIAVAAEQG
jgi:hypothetical protein